MVDWIKSTGPQQTAQQRHERDNPGDLIHLDIKRLGRFARTGHQDTGNRTGQSNSRGTGWEFVHVCVDDASPCPSARYTQTRRR